MKLRVFISYKREEHRLATKLRDQLHAWGFSTWMDTDQILPGVYSRDEIQEGLENSDVLVLIMTAESQASLEVMAEVDYFRLLKKPVIPLKYQECKLRYIFVTMQWIDLTVDELQGFVQLKHSLDNLYEIAHPEQNLATSHPETSFDGVTNKSLDDQRKATKIADPTEDILNRQTMLHKVNQFWIVGVLENKLRETGSFNMSLSISSVPTIAVNNTFLATSQHVVNIFDDADGKLLILGTPGSGKTTALLQLAQQLIARGLIDDTQPIPIIFNLSSWSIQRASLIEWLIDELQSKYQVPQKIAKQWIESDQLLLLLDGLDEVEETSRALCVEALNTFLHSHPNLKLVVCSRTADYEALRSKLKLSIAMMLQPLNDEQIDNYLSRPELHNLRTAIKHDSTLKDMSKVPLLLNMMVYAYQGKEIIHLPVQDESHKLHYKLLFEAYIKECLTSIGRGEEFQNKYDFEQTIHYLAWLAKKMTGFKQDVFYIENLQPQWLASLIQNRIYIWSVIMIIMMGFVLIVGLAGGLVFGSSIGLAVILVFGLINRSRAGLNNIQIADSFSWSWSRHNLAGAIIGGLAGTFIGSLAFDSSGMLGVGLLGSLAGGLVVGLSPRENKVIRLTMNKGPLHLARNTLIVALVVGLIGGVVRVLIGDRAGGLAGGITAGIILGLLGGLVGGGADIIKHSILRFILWTRQDIPWNYARFLDYCASIGLLRKVGGGYIFAHRYLLEYFADADA